MDTRIPVTILTGFLGSGKTTLLNKLIKQNPDKKLAIIENEFGEINIDSDLVVGVEDGIFELSSGCLCCELNDELVNVLAKLMNSQKKIDHLIVETTGIADPGPVAISFLSDPQIQNAFRLDAIIALVDAQFIEQQLEQHEEACKQVASADIILLNKIDKVESYLKDTVTNIVKRMNPLADIKECRFGEVEGVNLLEIQAFGKDSILKTKFEQKFDQTKKNKFSLVPSFVKNNNGSLLNKNQENINKHSEISSISVTLKEPLDTLKFNIWIKIALNRKFMPLYRMKGIFHFYKFPEKVILQAVNNQYVIEHGGKWDENEQRINRLVFIGKNLDRVQIENEVKLCIFDKEFEPQSFYEKMFSLLEVAELKMKGLL